MLLVCDDAIFPVLEFAAGQQVSDARLRYELRPEKQERQPQAGISLPEPGEAPYGQWSSGEAGANWPQSQQWQVSLLAYPRADCQGRIMQSRPCLHSLHGTIIPGMRPGVLTTQSLLRAWYAVFSTPYLQLVLLWLWQCSGRKGCSSMLQGLLRDSAELVYLVGQSTGAHSVFMRCAGGHVPSGVRRPRKE